MSEQLTVFVEASNKFHDSSKLGRDKTKLFCFVSNCVHTADTDKTRQFCLVRSGQTVEAAKQDIFGLDRPCACVHMFAQ